MASRLSVIAGDVLVLFVTFKRSFGLSREASRLNMRISITYLLLRDGKLTLLIAAVFQCIHYAMIPQGQYISCEHSTSSPFTPLIVHYQIAAQHKCTATVSLCHRD